MNKTNRDNLNEELNQAWNRYEETIEQLLEDFNEALLKAREDHKEIRSQAWKRFMEAESQ